MPNLRPLSLDHSANCTSAQGTWCPGERSLAQLRWTISPRPPCSGLPLSALRRSGNPVIRNLRPLQLGRCGTARCSPGSAIRCSGDRPSWCSVPSSVLSLSGARRSLALAWASLARVSPWHFWRSAISVALALGLSLRLAALALTYLHRIHSSVHASIH